MVVQSNSCALFDSALSFVLLFFTYAFFTSMFIHERMPPCTLPPFYLWPLLILDASHQSPVLCVGIFAGTKMLLASQKEMPQFVTPKSNQCPWHFNCSTGPA